MSRWPAGELDDPDAYEAILRSLRAVAVLGMMPESEVRHAAHYVPRYLAEVGYALHPIPIARPECTTILERPVVRAIADLPPEVELLNVFLRPKRFAPWLAQIVAARRPAVVWFQSGPYAPEFTEPLTRAGVTIVEDCIGCRRASMAPAARAFPEWSARASSSSV